MKFREHRGGLAESMETVVDLEDISDLATHVLKIVSPWTEEKLDITVSEYTTDGDSRIGWKELYIVTVAGFGVVGWLDSLPAVQIMDSPAAEIKVSTEQY